ncbi:carbohydrate ABC transporter substrate-binding protein [Candidatus Parcubacteria bacterium]|jgi:ABC-type glycerol-3-phosphate transport system substrate-binding protein|nr:carbohydrate ABC transporter substrate-binding protein [Candidatus Parcubacteria bacterium]
MKRHLKLFTLLILAVFVVSAGFGCQGMTCKKGVEYRPVYLEYWGVWDTAAQVAPLINTYQAKHPTIKITYRNFRYEEYEQKLLEAWADDRGPDLFAIPVTWLKEYQHRLVPIPPSINVPIWEMKGSIKPERTLTLKSFKSLSPQDVKTRYVPVVYDDVVLDDKIYGLPFSLETLVTFYNSSLLDKSSIPEPMRDFHDLIEQVPKITRVTEDNRVLYSAVSLGGTDNIPRFFDILSSLLLQSDVNMKGEWFSPIKDGGSRDRLTQVLNFYTDFARPGRLSYSWSDDLPNAFEMFANGRLAYFFGYSYHADELRDRGVVFDWGITNFPQTRGAEGTKYYTDYWITVVAKKSINAPSAWDFIQNASGKEIVRVYLNANKKPTALRSLIAEQMEDTDLKVFASQVLTADNWYEGYNIDLAEQYTAEIIDGLVSGEYTFDLAGTPLKLFVERINKTYTKTNE